MLLRTRLATTATRMLRKRTWPTSSNSLMTFAGACTSIDDVAVGAMRSCYDAPSAANRIEYDEVITVYLKDPIEVCGEPMSPKGAPANVIPWKEVSWNRCRLPKLTA